MRAVWDIVVNVMLESRVEWELVVNETGLI
jgi:hypothetical protein